jgi:hypothetical protein
MRTNRTPVREAPQWRRASHSRAARCASAICAAVI